MDDQNSLHRELKEQEFSTRSGSKGKQGTKTGTDTEEQQLAVLGEVVVVIGRW